MWNSDDYVTEFNYYYTDNGGSLPTYITKRPGTEQKVTGVTTEPTAPDEGGTPFGGFTTGSWVHDVADTPWWQGCPTGYKRSKTPPFKCVQAYYYGAGVGKAAIIGGVLLACVAATTIAVVLMKKKKEVKK